MVVKELVVADKVGAFIDGIRELFASQEMTDRPWSLDYEYVPSSFNNYRPSTALQKGLKPQRKDKMGRAYSAKTLLCAISQCLRTPPALDIQESTLTFKVFDTESSLYFCEVLTDYSSDIR